VNSKKYILEDLGNSLNAEGFIHPIEIDEKNVIITGELRWLAAKKAGIKTIPARILTGLSKDERLQRQLVENLQRHEMKPTDISDALQKLQKKGMSTRQIAKVLGKNASWVSDYLAIREAPKVIQSGIDQGEIALEVAKKVTAVPSNTQKQFVKKIIDSGLRREDVRQLADAIQRRPDKAEKILKIDMIAPGARRKINKLAPTNREIIRHNTDIGSAFNELTDDLLRFMTKNSPAEIVPLYRKKAARNLNALHAEIGEWIREIK
jgi:ParB/RepB/Spo0J family partition protein